MGTGWHTVTAAVHRWGHTLLEADRSRTDGVAALGLDETPIFRRGRYHQEHWGITVVNARRGVLGDIVAGRRAEEATRWIQGRSSRWRRRVRWAVIDLSGPYRKAFTTAPPKTIQVADPFHAVKLANGTIDDIGRSVQNITTGGCGTTNDPLNRIRRRLPWAHERATDQGQAKLSDLPAAGGPTARSFGVWHAEETFAASSAWEPRTRHALPTTPRPTPHWTHMGASTGPVAGD
ncbi:ISL3 family transposase [Candidatus Poriferisodalis sp.]|uniref:ISL3 family transposase n=1 Tax=Candidatus Poriferisodalis sp. TaxID=3101277 RepID=UPI003B51FB8A